MRGDPCSVEFEALAGIEHLEITDEAVGLTYDLRVIRLEQICEALVFNASELSFIARMNWMWARFQESIHLDDLNYGCGWDTIVQTIYVTHYRPHEGSGSASEGRRGDANQENDDG